MEKKSEVLTIRITPQTKQKLAEEAQKLKWTISKLTEEILTNWALEATTGQNGGAINFIIERNQNINVKGVK